MPTYDYFCRSCEQVSEIFHSMKEPPKSVCPLCMQPSLVRQVGMGAGLVFKGNGFYETDYKKSSSADSKTDEKQAKQSVVEPTKQSSTANV